MGNLIWLASYPKSGNTWLRAFLHNYLRQAAEPHDINRLRDLTATENDAALYRIHDPRPASSYAPHDVRRMRPLVHRALTEVFPDYVFVKTHNALLVEDGIPLITREYTAAAIYLVRDPRDVAVSCSHYMGWSVEAAIDFMASEGAAIGGTDAHVYERLASWSRHVETWTARANPRLLVLRYEDMLIDPQKSFGSVVRFLGADPPLERLSKAIEYCRFDELRHQERSRGFVERPENAGTFFREGHAGRWQSHLSPQQAGRIEDRHRQQMRRFAYL